MNIKKLARELSNLKVTIASASKEKILRTLVLQLMSNYFMVTKVNQDKGSVNFENHEKMSSKAFENKLKLVLSDMPGNLSMNTIKKGYSYEMKDKMGDYKIVIKKESMLGSITKWKAVIHYEEF